MNEDVNTRYCFVCGKIITKHCAVSHKYKNGQGLAVELWICNNGDGCRNFYIKNMDESYDTYTTHTVSGFCYVCGKKMDLRFGHISGGNHYKHHYCKIGIKKPTSEIDYNRERYHRNGEEIKDGCVKPWEDPESLFCDTSFLNKEFGLDVRKGDECKDEV